MGSTWYPEHQSYCPALHLSYTDHHHPHPPPPPAGPLSLRAPIRLQGLSAVSQPQCSRICLSS